MTRYLGYLGTAVAVAAILLATVLIFAESVAGGQATQGPPFMARTKWTYRHIMISPAGAKQTGTMELFYGGQMTHRGRTVHFMASSWTLLGMVERTYLQWTGTHFRQVASEAIDTQNNWAEIVFDRPFDIGVPANVSGTAVIFQNGVRSTKPWSYLASPQGTAEITVPAGTFQAITWKTVLRLGELETASSLHVVGLTGVRRETKLYLSRSLTTSWYTELVSGPVR